MTTKEIISCEVHWCELVHGCLEKSPFIKVPRVTDPFVKPVFH